LTPAKKQQKRTAYILGLSLVEIINRESFKIDLKSVQRKLN